MGKRFIGDLLESFKVMLTAGAFVFVCRH
jgi:hypothetical protein